MPSKASPSFPLTLGEGQGKGNQPAITSAKPVREITFAQAINEALAEEMRRDPRVFIIGEDVAEAGTPFKVLSGLVKEFGTERVIDSPISEAGIAGIGVGAAMTGMRPGGGHHVRRFHHFDDGSTRQSSGQDPLYVRRQTQSADGLAHDPRCHAPLRRPA